MSPGPAPKGEKVFHLLSMKLVIVALFPWNIFVLFVVLGRLRDYWPGWTDWSNRSEGKAFQLKHL